MIVLIRERTVVFEVFSMEIGTEDIAGVVMEEFSVVGT